MEEPTATKTFSIPVDSENKATVFRPFTFSHPHMKAFHLAWVSFFACFVSTFAAPPLLPFIRDTINLTSTDIGNAGIAAVCGAIFSRIAMGAACDLFGPRLASSALILITSPAVFCHAIVNSPASFILVRFFTGFSLATFVSTQFWMSSLFSSNVVGTVNASAAGWGNLGGGVTQTLMPFVSDFIISTGAENFTAWRIAFFIPGLMQMVSAFAVFWFGQDLPDGNFSQLKNSGEKHKDKASQVLCKGISKYQGWILALAYGYCFGVELTVDNIIAQYYYDRFDVKLRVAGIIAGSFGLANIISRPGGGILSDIVARKYGMRGRIWALFIVQISSGLLCFLLGKIGSLSGSVTVMLVFSFFVQASCGLTFGIVPFVSRRALGVISGMTGGGGNVGAVLTQVLFFRGSRFETEKGISLMGIMVVCCTLPLAFIHFPQWGGMFRSPSPNGVTEQDYYLSEWTEEERANDFHSASLKFAENSKGERGKRERRDDDVLPPASDQTPTDL